MALSAAEIQALFKKVGKVIHAKNISVADATAWRLIAAGTDDQFATAVAGDYDTQKNVVRQFHTVLDGAINNHDAFPARAKAIVDLWLKHMVATGVGLTSASTPAAILTALIANMGTASPAQTVGASGSFASGYQAYFGANYSQTVPSSGSPTIDDAWIDDAVV